MGWLPIGRLYFVVLQGSAGVWVRVCVVDDSACLPCSVVVKGWWGVQHWLSRGEAVLGFSGVCLRMPFSVFEVSCHTDCAQVRTGCMLVVEALY